MIDILFYNMIKSYRFPVFLSQSWNVISLGQIKELFLKSLKENPEILKKLEELQTHLKESELPEKAKNIAKDVMESLKQLVISGRENLTEEERRSILDEVEEKIRKLEEAIEAEQTAQ